MKKLFKKVFKKMKKIFKPIGRELKRGLKSVGKAFGKLGPIGTLALSLMLPGAGTVLGSLGNVVSNVAASAPFSGTIFGPVGKVIQGVAKVAQAGGKVYSSISEFVGNTVNGLTGGSFKGEMIKGPDGKMIPNPNYTKGASRKFGDWVSNKLDSTRRAFGLETSMDEKGFEQTLKANEEALSGVQSTTEIKNYAQSAEGQLSKSIPKAFSQESTPGIFDKGYKLPTQSEASLLDPSTEAIQASQRVQELSGPNRGAIIGEDISKTFSTKGADLSNVNRETITVPVGYSKTPSATLDKFSTDKMSYDKYNLQTKEVYKDTLTPEQIDAIDVENSTYFADFQNNRINKVEKFVDSKYKKDGKFIEEFDSLTSADLDRQMLRQDAAAIAKPATLVGGILSPDTTESTGGGSGGYVAPLPTSTDITRYQGSVEQTYRDLGYKGPNTMAGYHMMGAYGNTPINFLQGRQTMQVPQPITQMPSF